MSVIQVVWGREGLCSGPLPHTHTWGHLLTFCFLGAQTQVKFNNVTFSWRQPSYLRLLLLTLTVLFVPFSSPTVL